MFFYRSAEAARNATKRQNEKAAMTEFKAIFKLINKAANKGFYGARWHGDIKGVNRCKLRKKGYRIEQLNYRTYEITW